MKYVILIGIFALSGCANFYKNLVNQPVIISKIIFEDKDILAQCLNKEVHKHFGILTIVTSDVSNYDDISEVVVRAKVGVFIIFTLTREDSGTLVEVRSGFDAKKAIKTIEDCSVF